MHHFFFNANGPSAEADKLTVELRLLQDLDFADVDIVQREDALACLFDVLSYAVWDPTKCNGQPDRNFLMSMKDYWPNTAVLLPKTDSTHGITVADCPEEEQTPRTSDDVDTPINFSPHRQAMPCVRI